MNEQLLEEWAPIREFDNYLISNHGRVQNRDTERIMSLTVNQRGIVMAGLFKGGVQYKRSVTRLVANEFLPAPEPRTFDTPINLDGDRLNNHVDNIMWRPHWFAWKYHSQFKRRYVNAIRVPIMDMKTGDRYADSLDAASKFGLLEEDLVLAILNATFVWPTFQQFAILAE